GVDLQATYEGKKGKQLRWIKHNSPERYIDLDRALNLQKWPPRESVTGASSSVLADAEATCYAFSYVYAPRGQPVQLRITRDNNSKVWLNGELVSAVHDHQTGSAHS